MDEAHAVLERLGRIEALQQTGASATVLLGELKALVAEAEEWSRAEGGEAAQCAVEHLRSSMERDMIGV